MLSFWGAIYLQRCKQLTNDVFKILLVRVLSKLPHLTDVADLTDVVYFFFLWWVPLPLQKFIHRNQDPQETIRHVFWICRKSHVKIFDTCWICQAGDSETQLDKMIASQMYCPNLYVFTFPVHRLTLNWRSFLIEYLDISKTTVIY